MTCEEVGKDMDHVEGLQKNYDEFRKVGQYFENSIKLSTLHGLIHEFENV